MSSIELMWESFRRDVVPPDAPETQIVESRKIFLSGACALFWLIQKAGELDNEEGMAIFEEIAQAVDAVGEEAMINVLRETSVGGHG